MKIEEYLRSLPHSIMTGEDVELRNDVLREIFRFASLNTNDVFYHLGCGNGSGVVIALQEFGVKKATGIDNSPKKISCAKRTLEEKNLYNGSFRCEDIFHSDINDASVILFWFADEHIIEKMIPKFSQLKNGSRIITIWGPLTSCLPDKVVFPYILNVVPFKRAKDLREQMLAVFETDCIDFVVAWEFAERYSKAIGPKEVGNDRFLTILQSLSIWINAKNLGIACGDEIPQPVKNYMGILRTFFNIEMEHLLNQKST
ncbi:MAG: class I SAM-dependent methyltransferase [Thaumarchaeota archaeon]|nr:MAG: class I SAM-dependent methyltransferase [Nitrososphaerota archaeon]